MGIEKYLSRAVPSAPLAVLRMAFGATMLYSTCRFLWKGWVRSFYISPTFHFTFYGFGWVKAPGATGMYGLFALMAGASILILLGWYYRMAIIAFFLAFTYVELIDQTTYLNHYYFVSIFAFLLCWVPANSCFSVDARRRPLLKADLVPAWTILIFRWQLLLVYFFAGLSKLNYDWLMAAMPLRIWLTANNHLPVIGWLLGQAWMAYVFSWFGAIFDLSIGFLLMSRKFWKGGYLLVVVFHMMTGWLFNIGMFPYIMILMTSIFFPSEIHQRAIGWLERRFSIVSALPGKGLYAVPRWQLKLTTMVLALHFAAQLLVPLRYLCYPGKLYWTEEGYRFSWRVMLMEKGGTIFFHVKDPTTGRQAEVDNSAYLSAFQEKMMSTQPDMILQYAHYLADRFRQKGIPDPVVTAESYVTLNGSGSQLYVDSTVNLAMQRETLFGHHGWILPFHQKK